MASASPLATEVSRRLELGLRVATRAAGVVMRHFGRLEGYDEKSAIDFVTVADRESEAAIARELSECLPEDLLVLEEADGRAGARAKRAGVEAHPFAWCIDPLDGTTNFVHGYPAFAVAMGLLSHGRPALGIIVAPALGETWVGGVGVPALLNDKPIHVSGVQRLSSALLATGFPYDRRDRLDALLALVRAALSSAHDIRRSGSASLDLCSLAAGRIDGFFEEGLSPWDTAAGSAIVAAAGGQVSDYAGAPHDLFGPSVLATNGQIHGELRAMIAGVRG